MKRLPLKTIVEIMKGKIVQGTDRQIIHDIVTRATRLKEGALLFDLRRKNASHPNLSPKNQPYTVITDRPGDFIGASENTTVIQVDDINQAYWRFVHFYRDQFHIPVIGVTGTCGKTTTKEMIKHILSQTYKVNATYKSYNALFRNFGYLLEIDDDTQAAVIEMGVAFPGDLITSCRYFKPQVGVITNIGIDHLQGLGTLNAYIKAKAEILDGMGWDGTLIINADDDNIKKIDLTNFKGNVLTFGFSSTAIFKISHIIRETGFIKFRLRYDGKAYSLSIPGHGEFNVYNATAAIAAAHAAGLDVGKAGIELATFQNIEKHFEFAGGINGSTIIDDTWSTNPTSIEAALKLLKSLSQGKLTIAVLGKMSLLGKQSGMYHHSVGKMTADIGIDRLIVIGDGAELIGVGALQRGMNPDHVHICKNSGATYEVLKPMLDKNSMVLVKTSMLSSYKDLMDRIIVERLQHSVSPGKTE